MKTKAKQTERTESDLIAGALAIACELTGTAWSATVLSAAVEDLLSFGAAAILPALRRCRQEVRGRLTVADVLARLEDGRPSADAAWSMIPNDEGATIIWTEEMAEAYGVAHGLRRSRDDVGARLAFTREYDRLVREARSRRRPARWRASLGHDPARRAEALEAAVRDGRLAAESVARLLPPPPARRLLETPGALSTESTDRSG